MIVRSHKTRKLMSVVLMLAIMLSAICFGVPPKVANAAHLTYVEEDDYYYIKNVKSGKYMTVQGGSFTSDANIVQWHFTGDNNQKWKLHYTGDTGSNSGFYVFYAFNTNYVIAMPNGSGLSGLQAKLTTPSSCGNRKYFVVTGSLGNAAHRLMTVASNSILALVANNASIYDNTSIVQDQTGVEWSDQWLFEPVGYDNYFGRQYASENSNHRLVTYPNFDNCTMNDHLAYESTNFASQCLTASGFDYYKPENQWNNWWYINKLNHNPNAILDSVTLGQNWTITTSWYIPTAFRSFWVDTMDMSVCPYIIDAYDIVHMTTGDSGWNNKFCFKGDIILVRKNTASGIKNIFTLYTKEEAYGSGTYVGKVYWQPLKDCMVCTHSGNSQLNYTTLWYFLKQIGAETSHDYSIEIVHMI